MSTHSSMSNLVAQMPGIAAIKTIDSCHLAASSTLAQMVGFNDSQAMIGAYDSDLPCNAKQMADAFINEDKIVLRGGYGVFVNICEYSDKKRIIISKKKKITTIVDGRKQEAIFFQGENFDKCTQLCEQVLNLFKADQQNFSLDIQSYQVAENYPDLDLTAREAQCLFYLLRGKSAKHIATLLGVAKKTVERHFYNIRQRFGCKSLSDLMEYGLLNGMQTIILERLLLTDMLSVQVI